MSLLPWLTILSILHIIVSQSEEEIRKKTGVLACFALSRARMEQDSSFKSQLESNPQEAQRNMMFSLVRCYTSITPTQLSEILSTLQSGQTFDSKGHAYKKLLDYSKVEAELSQDKISKAMQDINEVLTQLRQEREGGQPQEYDDEGPNPNGRQAGFSLFNILQMFAEMNRSLMKMLALDGYVGVLIILVVSFFLLRTLNGLCAKKKTKKKTVESQEN